MTTTTIAIDQDVATLINVFTVTRMTQQPLVDLLTEATEQVMRHRPGFISANIHASLDGTRVVNYAQWRSRTTSWQCSMIPRRSHGARTYERCWIPRHRRTPPVRGDLGPSRITA